MDYRYLKAFLLTAELKSFSKAANALKIAQSAISRQIKLLEESIGEELIIRSSKKVLLTDKGRDLFLLAQAFDQETTTLFNNEDKKEVRIGLLHGLLDTWFAPLVSLFYKKHNRNMQIEIADQPDLVAGIEQGKYDIVFSTDNVQSDLVSSLKLFSEQFVLISKDELNLKRLQDYRWIVYSEFDKIFQVTKKVSENIISVSSITTIVGLVKNGVGIAVVPRHVLKKKDTLNVYELSSHVKSDIYMTTLNFKKLPPHVGEIYDLIQKQL